MDKWLTIAKSDLSERGHAFENYISNFLKHEKLNEFAKFKMFEQKSFSIINNDGSKSEEEIDLLIKTDTSLIIAEIKCITYPFESDDNYKSMQIIKKAKDQVVRKEKFLTDNWIHFKSLFGERENITTKKIIIVNFPQFSGRAIEGIPITDFYMFLSYFKSGQLTKVKLERGKQPVYDNLLYYNSKQSFSENFARFFLDPVPIKDVVSRQEIEEYEVTAKGTEPKTTSLRVIYKPRSI